MAQIGGTEIDFGSWRRAIREDTLANYHYHMGIALERNGDDRAAATAHRHAIDTKPDHGPAHKCLIDLLERTAQPEAAAGARERAARLCSDYAEQWQEERVESALSQGQAEEAAALLAGAGLKCPRTASLWVKLASYQRRMGAYSKAMTYAETAISLQPDHLEACREKGLLARILGRLDIAVNVLTDVLATAPSDLEVAANLAFSHLARLEFDAALSLTSERCRKPQGYSFLDSVHAKALLVLGRYDEAIAFVRSLDQWQCITHPDRWMLSAHEGLSLQAAGRVEEALVCYRWILEAGPDNVKPMAYSYVGLGLQSLGDLQGALESHLAAMGSPTANSWVLSSYALALLELGRDLEARTLLEKSLTTDTAYAINLQNHMRPWALERLNRAYAAISTAPCLT